MNTIKLELGFDARQFIQQVVTDNKELEEQIEKGINLAFEELCKDDNLTTIIKNQCIKQVEAITGHWEFQNKLRDMLQKEIFSKLQSKISEYSTKIANDLEAKLK